MSSHRVEIDTAKTRMIVVSGKTKFTNGMSDERKTSRKLPTVAPLKMRRKKMVADRLQVINPTN